MTKPGFFKGPLPRLLVSVRNAEETHAAWEGGAEIIDIKEPRNGSLGKAGDREIEQIVQTVRSLDENCPVSVALGELQDWQESLTPPRLPGGVDYVKLGFSRCQSVTNWREQWRVFRHRLTENSSASPQWVAVVYADWQSAEAPSPQRILEEASNIPCAAVLMDTFHKNGRSLPEVFGPDKLLSFADHVHQLGLPLALAGSLRVEDLRELHSLTPQIIAIRSAACLDGERGGPVCAAAVQHFRKQLGRTLSAPFPRPS